MPVVAKGEHHVFGLSLDDVAALVGIKPGSENRLSMDILIERLDQVLAAAERCPPQIPDTRMDDNIPDRDRSYRQLGHHIFIIADAFLAAAQGEVLSYESLARTPPSGMRTGSDVAAFGVVIRKRVGDWPHDGGDDVIIATYYGDQTLHQVLERTTWHAAQHVRQLTPILEGLGIEPEARLTAVQLAGLPMPEMVWDD